MTALKKSLQNILLVGQQNLQNSVIINYLINEQHLSAQLTNQADAVKRISAEEELTSLLLLDVRDIRPEQAIRFLNELYQKNSAISVAFINVLSDSKFEKLIDHPTIAGIFYAHQPQSQVYKGINALLAGDLWIPRKLLKVYLQQTRTAYRTAEDSSQLLTKRELQILKLTATGATNAQIADKLNVSMHTVKTHMYNLFKKIGASNRVQAINWANENLDSDAVNRSNAA
ncbi:LuxR C-terminal-related transcriptional regulator [Litoribrevibacter albus]|uniref:Transcriptional regulator CsgD n=1 Tax=Litoribrevibacter albus TaxID=1473156 RepID=A0AA37W4U9_9GAMM|nr:LuxR C-terminal-related transcriptional regulator [Litoribrevibacter albus]GLQ30492.1 transcriptional regulator CsgD [Litoribrevibacter albus]